MPSKCPLANRHHHWPAGRHSFAGAVLTETIFGLAGVGRMLFEAITARDFPIVQGFTVVIAIGYV